MVLFSWGHLQPWGAWLVLGPDCIPSVSVQPLAGWFCSRPVVCALFRVQLMAAWFVLGGYCTPSVSVQPWVGRFCSHWDVYALFKVQPFGGLVCFLGGLHSISECAAGRLMVLFS